MEEAAQKEGILKALAQMGTYSNFVPQQVSIGWVPFAIRNRYLFSHPEIVRSVAKTLAGKVVELGINALVGAETAGIPLAMAISLETGIPFAYVRKQPRGRGDRACVEGDIVPGATVALVDDLMTSAASKQIFVDNLDREGYKTTTIVVIWEGLPLQSVGEAWLAERALTVVKLYTWLELADGLHRYGFIPNELYPHYVDFIQHRVDWEKPGEKWRRYVDILENSGRTVPPELKVWLAQ